MQILKDTRQEAAMLSGANPPKIRDTAYIPQKPHILGISDPMGHIGPFRKRPQRDDIIGCTRPRQPFIVGLRL